MPQDFDPHNPPVPHPGEESGAEPCRTAPLVPNFSICLKMDRLCPYALSFGHQYLCRHPDHAKFAIPTRS